MLDRVDYWLDLASDDASTASLLINGKKYLQAGFFCHLTAEKALKAIIACNTTEAPPRTHDLTKLAERGGVFGDLTESQLNLLEELNPLNIEARYPEYKEGISNILTAEKTGKLLKETEGFLCWIKQRLGR